MECSWRFHANKKYYERNWTFPIKLKLDLLRSLINLIYMYVAVRILTTTYQIHWGMKKLQSGNAWHRFWKGEENSSKKSLQVKKKKGKFHDDLNYTYNFGFQCLIFSFFSLPISTYSQKPKKYGEAVAYLELYRTKYMHQIGRGV